jgi:hypothetical protein
MALEGIKKREIGAAQGIAEEVRVRTGLGGRGRKEAIG